MKCRSAWGSKNRSNNKLKNSCLCGKTLFSIALLLSCAVAVFAQDQPAPVAVPASAPIRVQQVLGRGLAYGIEPYKDRPADMTLVPHGPDARHGRIWLQTIGYGLLIVGEVDGERPDYPRNKNLILEKDHVEIWLADAKDPDLPPVGWGNQFDQITLPKGADSCADWLKPLDRGYPDKPASEKKCREWADTQAHYRPYFKRLFLRQWLVTNNYAVETFATSAFNQITSRFATDQPANNIEIPAQLQPLDKLQAWFSQSGKRPGYTFEILIPYVAFPPLSTLDLRDLRLMVDVFNPPPPGKKVGSYSTSSASRIYAKPETFNAVRLDPPQQFHLTPCNLPLEGPDKYGDTRPAWFVPKADQSFDFESNAFTIVNDGSGYQYEPEALSPVAHPLHYFWHTIAESEWICGPHLRYRKGDKTQTFDATVDEDGFDAHRLPGGDLLIKVGPLVYGSTFGSGQCGACPRTQLSILRLGSDMKLREVLSLGGLIDNGGGASQDFTVSPDWSQVVQYDEDNMDDKGNPGPWSSTTWCLKDSGYEQCGHKDKVEPPDPPVLKELRQGD